MKTFTTLTELANKFQDATIREFFISSFKNTVSQFENAGFDFKKANELTFEALITGGIFEKSILNLQTSLMYSHKN